MQLPALHSEAAVGEGGVLFVVGNDDEGGAALLAQAGHQLIKDAAVLAVEVAAWFVGQYQFRVVHQGAGNGDALLFTAGELRWEMIEALREAEACKQLSCPFFCGGELASCDEFRHCYIFKGGEVGEEVVELEDEADFAVAERCQCFLGERVFFILEQHFLIKEYFTAVGCVEGAKQVEQGRFAAS